MNGKFILRVGGADTLVLNTGEMAAAQVALRANQDNVLALAGDTSGEELFLNADPSFIPHKA